MPRTIVAADYRKRLILRERSSGAFNAIRVGMRRRAAHEVTLEHCKDFAGCHRVDDHPAIGVENIAPDSQLVRQSINERPKTDTLNDTMHDDLFARDDRFRTADWLGAYWHLSGDLNAGDHDVLRVRIH
jgi:hypothetical protein